MNINDVSDRIPWKGAFQVFWPIAVALIVASLWLGGRLETDQQKRERITMMLRPYDTRLDSAANLAARSERLIERLAETTDAHMQLSGHQVAQIRSARIEVELLRVAKLLEEVRVVQLQVVKRLDAASPE